jgi:hypothetical protein
MAQSAVEKHSLALVAHGGTTRRAEPTNRFGVDNRYHRRPADRMGAPCTAYTQPFTDRTG